MAGVMVGVALLGSAVAPVATTPAGMASAGTAVDDYAAGSATGGAAGSAAGARTADDRAIAHVLNRIAFGPAPGDVARVRAMGLDRYLDQQLHPERLQDAPLQARLARFETLQLDSREIAARFYKLQELQQMLRKTRGTQDSPATGGASQPAPVGEMGMPAAGASQTGAPQTDAPQTGARRTGAPRTDAPRTGARQTDTPQTDTPQTDAPRTGAPAAAAEPSTRPASPAPPERDERAERDEMLARLSPEERERLQELRRQNQQILNDLSEQKLVRAVYSERQLEEVLVDFWFNHFNVFAGKGPTRVYLTEYEREAIRPHVLGRFRDLLGATAHSPAMLFYLDNWQSSDPNAAANTPRRRMAGEPTIGVPRPGRRRMPDGSTPPPPGQFPRIAKMSDAERQRRQQARQQQQQPQQEQPQPQPQRPRRGLNENYARELMELHTLGVDGGGYTQQDIVEVAKCFTGWTIQEPRRGGGFVFDPRRHTPGPKAVLGKTIDKGGIEDGEAVLDLLASHTSTATFIATKLARRFVADEPPAALVERAAAKFRATDGNLREVVRTILTSPEFTSAEAMRAKVKTPFEFVASALRATGANVDDGMVLVRNLQGLGMPLYMAQPPTGYLDRADVWVNTGALLNRMNFAVALVNNRLRGVQIDLARLAAGGPIPPAPPAAMDAPSDSRPAGDGARAADAGATNLGATDLGAARDALLAALLSNEVSDATRSTIAKGREITQVAALTLGSPEFQRR